MTRRRRRHPAAPLPEAEPGPTPERLRRGDVERLEQTIADEAGRPSRPYRTVDTLARMLRHRSITPAMRQAGDDFRALFHRAALDPLAAPDLSRLPQGALREQPLGIRHAAARQQVWEALKALGGIASPAGSCVWHVLGCEWSLREWSLREGWGGRPLGQETAAGILIGALGVLQAQFGL
jgi:hypothetical protein